MVKHLSHGVTLSSGEIKLCGLGGDVDDPIYSHIVKN